MKLLTTRNVVIAGGVTLVVLLLWERFAGAGVATDPEGKVTLSSLVMKNGQCYRVDLYASGKSRSVEVPNAMCCDDNPALCQ